MSPWRTGSWPKPCGAAPTALHAAVCPVVEADAGSLGGADEQPELGAVAGADCESERAYGCADAQPDQGGADVEPDNESIGEPDARPDGVAHAPAQRRPHWGPCE